jgi:hypothetical protein
MLAERVGRAEFNHSIKNLPMEKKYISLIEPLLTWVSLSPNHIPDFKIHKINVQNI